MRHTPNVGTQASFLVLTDVGVSYKDTKYICLNDIHFPRSLMVLQHFVCDFKWTIISRSDFICDL